MAEVAADFCDWQLELPEGKAIHGDLRGEVAGRSVAVLVHGLPGNGRETLPFLGSRYLNARGLSTLALHLYDYPSRYRDLMDTSLAVYAQDLVSVVAALRQQGAAQVFGIGHSYGGLSWLRAAGLASPQPFLDAAVLWDPTHGLVYQDDPAVDEPDDYPQVQVGQYAIITSGAMGVWPERIHAENLTLADNSADAQAMSCPTLIISAGRGVLVAGGLAYLAQLPHPRSQQVVIDEASHGFLDEEATIETLLNNTHTWLTQAED